MMKKKVLALTLDTELTNEQIERGTAVLFIADADNPARGARAWGERLEARNVRVLDSDEIDG